MLFVKYFYFTDAYAIYMIPEWDYSEADIPVRNVKYRDVYYMEKIVRQALLYDFYGELLTEHQKNIYSDYVLEDLSYTEIGNNEGISRQAVYELIKRCDGILEEYESKLKLVDKFLNTNERISRIHDIAAELMESTDDDKLKKKISEIEQISKDIYESY